MASLIVLPSTQDVNTGLCLKTCKGSIWAQAPPRPFGSRGRVLAGLRKAYAARIYGDKGRPKAQASLQPYRSRNATMQLRLY